MDLHLETYAAPDSDLHRGPVEAKSVTAAMERVEEIVYRQEAKAAHLFSAPPGNVGFGNGELVAVYTPHAGFHELQRDLRPWWESLTDETQRALIQNADGTVPDPATREVAASGEAVAKAYFLESDEVAGWRLRDDVAAFVATMEFAPLGVSRLD